MSLPPSWYIVKCSDGTCAVLTNEQVISHEDLVDCWGPFPSTDEAIARKIGLIRSGKCKPK
jgi:hypothetical protein